MENRRGRGEEGKERAKRRERREGEERRSSQSDPLHVMLAKFAHNLAVDLVTMLTLASYTSRAHSRILDIHSFSSL